MLMDQDSENQLLALVASITSAYSIYMIGRSLPTTPVPTALKEAADAGIVDSDFTFLDASFMAGKAANTLGTDAMRGMSEADLVGWLKENKIKLDAGDQAILDHLKNNTSKWLQSRSDAWQANMRADFASANQRYLGALAKAEDDDDDPREDHLSKLSDDVDDDSEGWTGDVSRLVQTEMNTYFQHGQTAGVNKDELIYKVPSDDACIYCLDLHVDDDGKPILYYL